MILADTSVWIDHLRSGDADLRNQLEAGNIIVHPRVLGELACGVIPRREAVLSLIGRLPRVTVASDVEVLSFIETHRLMGRGIGLVDAHLLASVSLTPETLLWTRDRSLARLTTLLALTAFA